MPGPPVAEFHWFLLPLAIALAGTRLALGYARRRGLVDQPGERRSHALPTPRGGGIAIVGALLLAILAAGYLAPESRLLLQAGGLGLVLVAAVGWIDDHRPLSPVTRLAAHAVSAALLAAAILLSGHGPEAACVAFVAVPVLVNVWNFMDGINGLAASQAMLAGLGFAWLAGEGAAAWLALALAGACLGFLPFNFPNARIFLGDVGSGALGHALAMLAVLVMLAPGTSLAPAQWPLFVLPLSAFLVDAGLTLARRAWRRERWWEPHVQHAYQVWSRKLGRHAPVTLAYAGWALLGSGLMVWFGQAGAAFIIAVLVAGGWCLAGGLGWVLLQGAARGEKGRTYRQ